MPGGGFHGMGGMPRKPKGDTTKLYKTLGVETKASQVEIRKAYRKLARQHHPDRGGDAEKFKEVQNAYDVLNDEGKRKAYDATGDPNADPRSVRGVRKRKGASTKFELEVPLEQFYNGHTRRIKVTKNVVCDTCDGQGGSGVTGCTTCRGRGIRVIDRQIGPGMIQRMQVECNTCDGKGTVIPRGQRCTACRAAGIKKSSSVLSVHIERGMKHGEKITFSEEGDQHPDTTPGDVIVILKKKRHHFFTRDATGCHLVVQKKISLVEALTGFSFIVEHLDGRQLQISSRPGQVYKTGSIEALRDEGMPLRGDYMTRGHMYIELEVVYPTSLTSAQQAQLKSILGGTSASPMPIDHDGKEIENVSLESVDLAAEKRAYEKILADTGSMYDDDEDDEMGGGQQMQCRQQ